MEYNDVIRNKNRILAITLLICASLYCECIFYRNCTSDTDGNWWTGVYGVIAFFK